MDEHDQQPTPRARRAYGQRVWTHAVRRVRLRGATALSRALRLTGAATAAYVVAVWLLPSPRPLLSALTALLIVQVTLFGTLQDSARRVVSVIAGVALAVLFATGVGFHWWSLGALIAASIIVGQLLRLGPHLLEVPISAMLVLGIGAVESAAADRVVETLIGAGVGVAVNVLAPPAEQVRSAGVALEHYADEIVDFLDRTADELSRDGWADATDHWVDGATTLTRHANAVERTLDQAQESRRLNPRALGRANPDAFLRSGLEALETCVVAIRGLSRMLAEGAEPWRAGPDLHSLDLRLGLAGLLRELGGAVRAFAAVVQAEAESEPEEEIQDEDLAAALDGVRHARMRVSGLIERAQQHDPRQWQLHDALLFSVERVLRELDDEERARLRRHRFQGVPDGKASQAISRLRAGTRQLAELHVRTFDPPAADAED